MRPCCLEVITCEELDHLVFQNAKHLKVGGNMGEHHYCPETAEEAHNILSGNYILYLYAIRSAKTHKMLS